MTKLFLTLALVFAFAMPAFAADKTKESAYERVMRTGTIRIGYALWPPYITKDPASGTMGGMVYELVERTAKVLNLKTDWALEYAPGQQVEALKTGKVDVLALDGPWTRSAMPYSGYSRAQFYVPVYIHVAQKRAAEFAGKSLDTLNRPDFSFSAMDGDLSLDLKEMLYPAAKFFTLPGTADPTLLMENIMTGKADALIQDSLTVQSYNKTRLTKNQDGLVALHPEKPLAIYPCIISAQPQELELLGLLDRGIDFLHNMGMDERILRKYDPNLESIYTAAPEYAQDRK